MLQYGSLLLIGARVEAPKMSHTRKITYTAVGAALASIFVFLTNFGWLKVSFLMAAALVYFLVCCKCGIWYGLADVAISLLLVFFTAGVTPLSSAFLLTAFIFAPYAIIAYFMRKLYYTKWRSALLRLGIVAVFANLALLGVWLCAKWITTFDIPALAGKIGGYAVLALLFTVFALAFDFLFNQLSLRLLKLLK